MNILEALFVSLGVFMIIAGLLTNFGKAFLPQTVAQLLHYGRANMSKLKPSFIRRVEVPKRWFYHFYAWAVIMQFSVVISLFGVYSTKAGNTVGWLGNVLSLIGERQITVTAASTMIATSLFLFHLCRRLFETLFVSIFSNTKMNVAHYFLGYLHYTAAILSLVAHSPEFNSGLKPASMFSRGDVGFCQIIGAAVFLLGNFIQYGAHAGLANLRKGKDKKETLGHQIPRGNLFEYISCPNYFAEILIYCALSTVYGFKNSTLNYCTVWVICNQIVSGVMNHTWYIETFKDYPKQRKAVIPFIL